MEEDFNIFKIRNTVCLLCSKEEKLNYLLEQKVKLQTVISCFEENYYITLKSLVNYSSSNYDICPELISFVKEAANKTMLNPFDRKFISEDMLRKQLDEKIFAMKNDEALIEAEIEAIREVERTRRVGNMMLNDGFDVD